MGARVAGSGGVFHADLHVHSRYSRACSKDGDIPQLAWWAARKGITVVGTGDFTHPAWMARLKECLIPAEPGLLRLRPELEPGRLRTLPPSCRHDVRFLLSAEISTIYKRDGATRKVHHLVYAPAFEAAEAMTAALAKVGNLASDGRPILGLDSRHLLDITLNAGPGCFLVPAHIWTPWFAVLGSKSGFDAVTDCYGDLADHIFALETGLSSDPPMNWMCSQLDGYRLVSNSDAHSPPMLGREATTFGTPVDYFAMRRALRTGEGLAGTINFFPEGGRYHLDGHRKCGIRFDPAETKIHGGMCPRCGKPLTVGVLHRVAELADLPPGRRPDGAAAATNLVSLPEIVAEIRGTGPKSKSVTVEVDRLVAALGPELRILRDADVAEVGRAGGGLLAEAITRLRRGAVIKEAGYDGEYGVIRLFGRDELARAGALFEVPARGADHFDDPERLPDANPGSALAGRVTADPAVTGPVPRQPGHPRQPAATGPAGTGPVPRQREGEEWAAADVKEKEKESGGWMLGGLDQDQRAAAEAASPLMIIAGPGTGKTRTLTWRIAAQVATRDVPPGACLALTFTRRAAEEMRARLARLMPDRAGQPLVTTFHGLGLAILREHGRRAGLADGFTVADDAARLAVAAELAGSPAAARRLLADVAGDPVRRAEFAAALAARNMADFDALLDLPVTLLREDPAVAAELRERWPVISVDEYQDIDASQYALLRLLAGDGGGLTAIGDPDQAIYGFRGADVSFFLRFSADYPAASTARLTRNYRSSPAIVAGALQAVAPVTLVPGRELHPVAEASRGAPGQGPPAKITVHEAADEQGEAAWIAEAIDRLLGGSSFHSLDSGRADGHAGGRLGLADIAVLYRTDAQAGALGQALTRAGLPFQKRSHDLLVRRTSVPEIVREMRAVSTAGAAPGGGEADGDAVADRLTAAVRRLTSRAPGSRTAASEGAARPGTAAVDVLAAGEVLAPLARRCGTDLERFATEIALGAEADALDPRADAITLLTLHAAKGLEFSVVFLAGCERGLLPLWLPGGREEGCSDPAEERRLLFVGMTRARAHLLMSYAARRQRHGTGVAAGPSPFLASISPALLERPERPGGPGRGRPRRPDGRQLRLL